MAFVAKGGKLSAYFIVFLLSAVTYQAVPPSWSDQETCCLWYKKKKCSVETSIAVAWGVAMLEDW